MRIMALTATVVAMTLTGPAMAEAGKGARLFVDYKCNRCHAVKSAGIARDGKPNKKASPDLSDIGRKRSADWLRRYLLKKEKVNGRKHKKKFRGPDADLAALIGWLATLKGAK